MSIIIRYVETSDEFKVRYAEYLLSEGSKCFELLDSDTLASKARLAELRQQLKDGTCRSLSVKWGFCWAEYINTSGYSTHTPLKFEDFLPGASKCFMPELEHGKNSLTGSIMREDHRLRKHIHYVHHNPEIQGTLREIDIRFGSKVPQDYYGNYDYGKYPGGYSPSAATSGDW